MGKKSSSIDRSERSSKEHFKVLGPALLITLIGFVVAYQFVEPAPPRKISIGTGSTTGAYYPFGLRYREILARDGITLEVRGTAGSLENIRLLQANENGVDVAFVQGGIGNPDNSPPLSCLGSLYFEPLWVFLRAEVPIKRLSDLRGKRIAVGAEGSGTRAVALQLLADNAITQDAASILPLGGPKAAEALVRSEIDAAFFVSSPRSSLVRSLLETKSIHLMSFERAEGYTRVHRFLSSVTLPEGVINFETNIPQKNTVLVAPAANLVARKNIHPALIDLLLQAASEVHGGGSLFEKVNEFPSQKFLDFPLHKDARRFFKSGPPFLQRYLPFWAATLIDRLKVMLLPLITLLIPLMKIVPPSYRWRVRSRIFHWYKELQAVEQEASESDSAEQFDANMTELKRIEKDVVQVSVPLSYAYELYALRLHIAYVRKRLLKLQENRL